MPVSKPLTTGLDFEDFVERAQNIHPIRSRTEILHLIECRIRSYEEKYGMSSQEFVRQYDEGKFEMDDRYPEQDLFRWRSYYRGYRQEMESESEP